MGLFTKKEKEEPVEEELNLENRYRNLLIAMATRVVKARQHLAKPVPPNPFAQGKRKATEEQLRFSMKMLAKNRRVLVHFFGTDNFVAISRENRYWDDGTLVETDEEREERENDDDNY